jgi:hypothetical protein
MSGFCRKVIHASSIALGYGPEFTVKERYLPLGFFFSSLLGIMAIFPMVVFQMSLLGFCVFAKLPWIGKRFLNWLAPPGSGYPDYLCKSGSTSVYATATAKPEYEAWGKVDRAYTFMSFKGDAGNFVTAQCCCESALALVFNRNELPERSSDGFGTPAELLGKVLLKRFRENRVRPVEISTIVRKGAPKYEMKIYK